MEVWAFDRDGRDALIDFCGLVGDVVAAGLPEDVLQAYAWNARTLQQIVEHVAGAYARELVGVTYEYDAGRFGNGF